MPREVRFKPSAARQLAHLPRKIARQIAGKIDAFAQDPDAFRLKPIRGTSDLFRLRSGDYRVVLTFDEAKTIWVLKIGDRKEVYRSLP